MDGIDGYWMDLCLFDAFWMCFGWVLDGFGMVFGWLRIDFDGFWMHVWMDFGWILDGLGKILDGCLMDV